jgi:hypothetical protein
MCLHVFGSAFDILFSFFLFLFSLILVFLILNPLLEKNQLGEAVLLFSMYATLISATRALSERTRVRWPATLLAASSMLAMAIVHFFSYRPLGIEQAAKPNGDCGPGFSSKAHSVPRRPALGR